MELFKKARAINRAYCKHAERNVADPDPGSDAFLTPGPGSGIGFFWIPDFGSRIPDPKHKFLRA